VRKEIEFWRFVRSKLEVSQQVVLLVVAESSGSSPGRAGYKMSVASDGELHGSIGGGLMEVNLVEKARALLSEPGAVATASAHSELIQQVHQKHSPDASGMICSGRQAVILQLLTPADLESVDAIAGSLDRRMPAVFKVSDLRFQIVENASENSPRYFSKSNEDDFVYQERVAPANELIIIGGGHCALALSGLMTGLNFRIRILDDRPELNTLLKNEFADDVTIVDSYENIGQYVPDDPNIFVAVMTLGYASDAVVIRQLIGRDLRYFGVLGSKAKMATLMRELRFEGLDQERLATIHAPIGVMINSQTPEEIAVSIAAEIIAVRNAAEPPA